jgi:Tfp pilus assembly protein PilN
MTQHLDLLGPARRTRQDVPWSLAHAATGIILLVLACLAGDLVMDHLRRHTLADLIDLQQASGLARQRLAGLQTPAASSTLARLDEDLADLHQQGADRDMVRRIVAGGSAGRPQGHAELLLTLARQADPAVWLTGLQVNTERNTLELRGRMRDAAALPGYLAHLQLEPLFQGRRFDQLGMRRVDAGPDASPGASGPLEFTLRSQPGGTAPTPAMASQSVPTPGGRP